MQQNISMFTTPHYAVDQFSMHGQAVNLSLSNILSRERSNRELPKLVNIGSCNLHVLHTWGISKRSLIYSLEIKTLAKTFILSVLQCWCSKRRFFKNNSINTVFSFFLYIRWVESKLVAERAVDI